MKNLFLKISLLIIASLIIASCRSNDDIPEDIHEHEEIEKMVVTITNKNNPSDLQKITFLGGKEDKHIHLQEGESYLVSLDFQVRHDDHYHSVNDEIITEKEEHFITYNFAESAIQIKRSEDDTRRANGKKIGLKTEWKVNQLSDKGAVNIKLVHGATSVDDLYPTVENQLGKAVGGGSDVDANIGLHAAH